MSYEDSFEREAADERAYKGFEAQYVYENMRPKSIGKWEWNLMFNRTESYDQYSVAATAAREMAKELGKTVDVLTLYEGCFKVQPTVSSFLTFAAMRHSFIKTLVVEDRYPDIVRIANDTNVRESYRISHHYITEVCAQHLRWKAETGSRNTPQDAALRFVRAEAQLER